MTRNLLLAFAVLVTGGSWASAQSASSELYGEGVHRYFAHDYAGADQLLTEAIAGGSQDPRAYYFRGLTKEMMGSGGEADFEEGAKLESAGRSGPMISYSLARVQGQVRAKIEKGSPRRQNSSSSSSSTTATVCSTSCIATCSRRCRPICWRRHTFG
ncbi:MAG: hypothetical protein U0930_15770 [Pirellulales bacterium]